MKKTTTAKRPRRRSTGAFNPGQVHLLIELMREFGGAIAAQAEAKGEALDLEVATDLPGLPEFFHFKLSDLKLQQDRLAALYLR